MKIKTTSCSAFVFLSLFWALPAASQSPIGVWTAKDPNDGSTAYLAIAFAKEAQIGSIYDVTVRLDVAFTDSNARGACAGTFGGGPFVGITGGEFDLTGSEMVFEQTFTVFGVCRNKKDTVFFDIFVRYTGDTDTLRAFGVDFRRFDFDPQVFVQGVLELNGTSAWLVTDLVVGAPQVDIVNSLCKFFAGSVFDPPESFVGADFEIRCDDGIDNDCNGRVDAEDKGICPAP